MIAAFRSPFMSFNHRFPPNCPSQSGRQATASTDRAVGAWEEEEDGAHQGLQGGKTHVSMGEGGTRAAKSIWQDPSLQHDENNRDFSDCRTWCSGGVREHGRTLAQDTLTQSLVPGSSSHGCPWSRFLPSQVGWKGSCCPVWLTDTDTACG